MFPKVMARRKLQIRVHLRVLDFRSILNFFESFCTYSVRILGRGGIEKYSVGTIFFRKCKVSKPRANIFFNFWNFLVFWSLTLKKFKNWQFLWSRKCIFLLHFESCDYKILSKCRKSNKKWPFLEESILINFCTPICNSLQVT